MSMDKRSHFLNQIWQAYPAAPADSMSLSQAGLRQNQSPTDWVGGEILQILRGQRQISLILGSQGQHRQYEGSHLLLFQNPPKEQKSPTVDGLDILVVGDKVVLREVDGLIEVVLLAPCLKEFSKGLLTPETARRWQEFLRDGREHFTRQGFIEVSTPTLVTCPGYEPTLEPFMTQLQSGRHKQNLFLPTSPEIHLKKMLARGWSEIFEFRPCFRNDEFSPHHQPEFMMLEWYRSYCGLDRLKQDVRELFAHLSGKENLQFLTFTVTDLFKEVLNFPLTAQTSAQDLYLLAKQKNVPLTKDQTWNDLFHHLWVQFVDPWLAEQDLPLFVTHYPPSQAALARLGEDGWAERLEVYWRGLEIANGYHELNDPFEQRKRSQSDLNQRKVLGKTETPNDEEFLKAMAAGQAPGVGIALGVERLFMAIHGIKDIKMLKAFPTGPESRVHES